MRTYRYQHNYFVHLFVYQNYWIVMCYGSPERGSTYLHNLFWNHFWKSEQGNRLHSLFIFLNTEHCIYFPFCIFYFKESEKSLYFSGFGWNLNFLTDCLSFSYYLEFLEISHQAPQSPSFQVLTLVVHPQRKTKRKINIR